MDWLEALGYAPTATPVQVILLRLLVAAVLGGVIGFERETGRHRAGLRTHILIALAAALYTTIVMEVVALADGTKARVDTGRAVEAVTAGIAFLGAGAIFQQRGNVHGLTTGAGMWLAGAVGLTSALGHYIIAATAAFTAVAVFVGLGLLERHALKSDVPEEGQKKAGTSLFRKARGRGR